LLSLRIALRYLLSRKSHGAVNIISVISLAAIAVAAAAMVIVLSVFNGFSQLAQSKLSAIDPDFMLTPIEGKTIGNVSTIIDSVSALPGVTAAAPEITEQAFAVAEDMQMPVTVKGMSDERFISSGIQSIIIDGSKNIPDSTSAMISVGVAMRLNLRPSAGLDTFSIYEPRRVGRINPANPMAAFRSSQLIAASVFQVEQEEYDRDMVVMPYAVAASLLSYFDEATSVAVSVSDHRMASKHLDAFAKKHGLIAKNRHMQQQQAFRMIAIEKWITFVMLAFILVIASCNIISTLSMLILEKENDTHLLGALGATHHFINRLFQTQGWLIVVIGGIAGISLGTLLVLGQSHFGWIKLGASDPSLMSVETYPVVLYLTDIATTFATILAVAMLITPVVPLIRSRRSR